jgi:hypothetical protein
MDETIRRDERGDAFSHQTSKRVDDDKHEDGSVLPLIPRRERTSQPAAGALTQREREERWPIG